MRKRIIFLDVDGTLVEHGHPIQESTKIAVRQAREAGHKVFICTGRAAVDVQPEIRALGFDGEITNGGAFAHIGDEEIVARTMNPEDVHFLTDLFESNGLPVLIQTHEQTYASARARELMQAYDAAMRVRTGDENLPPLLPELPDTEGADLTNAAKVLFVSDTPVDFEQLQEDMGPRFHLIPGSMPLYQGSSAEVIMAGVTKGAAIQKVLDHLGMTPEDAVGVGDSWNDVEMFDLVADAVAMENADEGVKARANHITTSVLDNGLHNALVHLGLVPAL